MSARKAAPRAEKADKDRPLDFLRPGGAFFCPHLPGAAGAHLALSAAAATGRAVVAVADGARALDELWRDLDALRPTVSAGTDLCYFPAWESLPGHGTPPPADLIGDRLATLERLGRGKPCLVATCVQALMQRTVPPEAVRGQSRVLKPGDELDPDAFLASLVTSGYDVQVEIFRKGQAALRGGILDLWPVTAPVPCRIELFGNTIESLRTFDPTTQRSVERVAELALAPAAEPVEALTADVLAHVPADAVWIWLDEEGLHHHAALYEESARAAGAEAHLVRFDELQLRLMRGERATSLALGLVNPGDAERVALDYGPMEGLPTLQQADLQPDLFEQQRAEFVRHLQTEAAAGWRVRLHFATNGGLERFLENHAKGEEDSAAAIPGLELVVAPLTEGFLRPRAKEFVVSESDFHGRRKERSGRYELHGDAGTQARARARQASERIVDWHDMQPGDFVVHVDHGIGRYEGLFEIEFSGARQEVLRIEYAAGAKLYLPVGQTHLLSRYVGVGKARPELHTLGGKRWDREKRAAQEAVQDLASLLLETQAARNALEGHAFGADTAWQHEFEHAFPFQETPDQQQAIDDVKRDMEALRPMDRLVCGDVGYGKTEVAMRAAFKAVMDGRQVAMLVPTTILAQQHYESFTERMSAFPVRIAVLSRFQTRGEQNAIVKRLKEGAVDIVIGTHRLVQADIGFKDLGLVIIDEEQKFGVAHKEHFKRLRRLVDVLTLTATPIPRTLYMSLVGARDLSVIETPPVERLPIETIVAPNTDEVVREAVLRELNREGQVYYLHNRVGSIQNARERLQRLVPEARIDVGHGQMHEHELESVMRRFVAGELDVLLCTTIIESGLDIPNVNTILIERADHFGMAELYQLRGRVGRFKRKAYAYFLLPRHGQLFDTARKRIQALRKHSGLGAGFRMAMRDLEIRGAGNVLGAEQSGHIAAVGFDLYCQLLKRTVAAMKGEKIPQLIDVEVRLDFLDLSTAAGDPACAAAIPIRFVEDETQRVAVYRKIAGVTTGRELDALREDLRDRFGKLPPPVERLLKIAGIRLLAARHRINRIETREEKVLLSRRGDFIMPNDRHPRLAGRTADAKLAELAALLKGL